MMTFIKKIYAPADAQDILRADGLIISAVNIVASFMNYNKRFMTKKEVDTTVKILYDALMEQNELIESPASGDGNVA